MTCECATFEMGPIRPPNEAASLLVRVTRNCPWNRCTFCPVYKGAPFSLRSVDEIKADIGEMARLAGQARELSRQLGHGGEITARVMHEMLARERSREVGQMAMFLADGGRSAFLQDANSLILPLPQLLEVLGVLRASFPGLERVTTYARAHTVLKRSVEQLGQLRQAGLDRIHIGLESGSDRVLELVQKGVSAAKHIAAGLRVKEAGIELSEYVMPGLGGAALSDEHARETARVLRAIDPHFIRLRTLAVPSGSPLAEQQQRGEFEPLGDVAIARELRQLLAGLEGMTSAVRSDHVLNLLEEIDGQLPDDLPKLIAVVDRLLALPEHEQELFVVGRRLGLWRRLDDMDDRAARARAEAARAGLRAKFPGDIDDAIRSFAGRYL